MIIHKILVETLTQQFSIDLPLGAEITRKDYVFPDGQSYTSYDGLADLIIIAGKRPKSITFVGPDAIKADF